MNDHKDGEKRSPNMARNTCIAGLVVTGLLALTLVGCARHELFNGKTFMGWTAHVDEPDVDPWSIWSVRDGVIHCAGTPNGYIRTVDTFGDFRLHLEWRWVDNPTNSGVLLRASGPDKVWPRCIEAQLKAGNAGDFVLIGHPGMTVDGVRYQDDKEMYVIVPRKDAGKPIEKPAGQWNTYDIECIGRTIKVRVNGTLQNEAIRVTDTQGWICLQSEGSPIEFRNIYVERLD
jgi:hypothetical protein